MSLNFIQDAAKDIVYKVIPPVQRYFTYFFIAVGVLWLGGANYYYFAEECAKFKGTLITGLIFFVLALCTAMWEYYMKRKKVEKTNRNELLIQALPIFLPVFFNIFKRIILNPGAIKTLAIIGVVGSSLYYALANKGSKHKYKA